MPRPQRPRITPIAGPILGEFMIGISVAMLTLWMASRISDAAAGAFGELCALCLAAARRPLLRHASACPCLGGDEAAFAEVVRLAAGGEREDALMVACCLVRPDLAPALVHLAEQAGIRLGRAVAVPAMLH